MVRRSSELVYPSCVITLQNVAYKGHKLLVLISFEVTTVTSVDSQEPTCCDMATSWLLNEVGANMVHFGGTKFNRRWD